MDNMDDGDAPTMENEQPDLRDQEPKQDPEGLDKA